MIKKIFVTTFNYSLFEKYANKLIDSFIKTNQNLKLYCYVEDIVSAITPVPGGVGPMTIACLLRNTTIAFKNSNNV